MFREAKKPERLAGLFQERGRAVHTRLFDDRRRALQVCATVPAIGLLVKQATTEQPVKGRFDDAEDDPPIELLLEGCEFDEAGTLIREN